MNQELTASYEAVDNAGPARQGFRRYLASSDRRFPKLVRSVYQRGRRFSIPAPRIIVKPMLWAFLAVQSTWHFVLRVFVCEPITKAYFTKCGRRFRGDCHIPWVIGTGDVVVGDDVEFSGKVVIAFGARFKDRPTLVIGDNSGIGHECQFVVGSQITIGRDCNISGSCWIADSNGHPSDPAERLARKPPSADDIRPVVIGDGVWIGRCSLIFPGVKIGVGSIVSAGSVVRGHIPPYSVVAGNPAKVVFRMKPPAPRRSVAAEAGRSQAILP